MGFVIGSLSICPRDRRIRFEVDIFNTPVVTLSISKMELENEIAVAKEAVRLASLLCANVQSRLRSVDQLDKADRSPVTVADFGAQALVLNYIAAHFPDDPAVGEEDANELENPENAVLLESIVEQVQKVDPSMTREETIAAIGRGDHPGGAQGRFWTLDPIDGTKGFLRGEQYAVALALIVNGEVALGVLGCPNLPVDPQSDDGETGVLLFASKAQGAFQAPLSNLSQGSSIATDGITDAANAVFCESVESGHTAHGRSAKIGTQLKSRSKPFRIDSQCKYAAVARGQASAYLRLPTRPGYEEKIWDHAAGHIILTESGGRIADTLGQPLDFSLGRTLKRNKGVVATSPGVFQSVLKATIESAQA